LSLEIWYNDLDSRLEDYRKKVGAYIMSVRLNVDWNERISGGTVEKL